MPSNLTTHSVRPQFSIPEQAFKGNQLNKLVKFDPVSQKIVLQPAQRQQLAKVLGQFSQKRQAKAIHDSYVTAVKDLANYSMQKYGISRNYKLDIDYSQLSDQLEALTLPGKAPSKAKVVAKVLMNAPTDKVFAHSKPREAYGVSTHNINQTIKDLKYAIENGLQQIEHATENKDQVSMDQVVKRHDKSIVSLNKLPRGELTRVHDEALTDQSRVERGTLIQNLKYRYTDQTRLRDSFFDLMDQVVFSSSNKQELAKSVLSELSSEATKHGKISEDNFDDIGQALQPKLEKLAMNYLDKHRNEFSKYTKSIDKFASRSNSVLTSLYQSYATHFAKAFADNIPNLLSTDEVSNIMTNPQKSVSETAAKNTNDQALKVIMNEISEISDDTQKSTVDGHILLIDYNNYHAKPDDKNYGLTDKMFAPARVLLNDSKHAHTPLSLRRENFTPIAYQQEEARNQHLGMHGDKSSSGLSLKSITSTPNEVVIFNAYESQNAKSIDEGVRFNQHTDSMKLNMPGGKIYGSAHDDTFNVDIKVQNDKGDVSDATLLFAHDKLWPADQGAIAQRVQSVFTRDNVQSVQLSETQSTKDLTGYVKDVVVPSLERFSGTRKQLLSLFSTPSNVPRAAK